MSVVITPTTYGSVVVQTDNGSVPISGPGGEPTTIDHEAALSAAAAQEDANRAELAADNASNSAVASAASAASALAAPTTSASSTTSLTIGTGSKSLTIQTGKAFVVGQWVTIANTTTPANYMHGQVTAHNSGTGALTVNAGSANGSGTLTAWTVSASGPSGVTGTLGVANGGTGTTTAFTAGSLVFARASGVYSQDNANLFWDDTNDQLGIGTSSPGGKLNVVDSSSNDAVRITQTGTGNALVVEDSTSPDATPFVVRADGRLVQGHTSSLDFVGASYLAEFLGYGSSYPLAVGYTGANALGANLNFAKNRSSDWSTNTIVQSGDVLGELSFTGADGTNHIRAARIVAQVDGTPGTNDMPGRLSFFTTPDSGSIPTERVRIDSTGYVGIGTTNPTARLNVVGPNEFALGFIAQTSSTQTGILNHPVATLANTSIAAANGVGLRYQISDTSGTARTAGGVGMVSTAKDASSITADMYFYTGSSEKVRVTNSGNVGIGTTGPAFKLDVGGDARASVSVANTLSTVLTLENSANSAAPGAALALRAINGNSDAYVYNQYDNGAVVFGIKTRDGFAGTIANRYTIYAIGGTTLYHSWYRKDGAEAMRLDDSGNFLVGNTTGTTRLHVTASGNDNTAVFEYSSGSATVKLLGNAASQQNIHFGDSVSYRGALTYDNATNFFAINTNSAERMRIDSSGNVGIGTSSPGALLDVQQSANASVLGRVVNTNAGASADARLLVSNGTTQSGMIMRGTGHASANDFVLFQASNTAPMAFFTNGSERMRVTNTGNVGIGTTSPGQKLTVAGTVESTTGGFKFPDGTTQTTAITPLALWDYWNENWFGGSNQSVIAGSWLTGAVIGSGTTATAPATAQAKGYNPLGTLVRSSTTVDSGWKGVTNSLTAQYFGVIAQKFRAMLTPATAFANSTIRTGWLNTITVTAPTTGAWFEMNGSGVWSAKCSAGGAVTTNATTYASTIDVPLTLDVEVDAAGTSVRYRIYAGTSTTAVLDVTNTTNIPTSFATGTGSGIVATNSGGAAVDICVIHALMQGTPAGYNRLRG